MSSPFRLLGHEAVLANLRRGWRDGEAQRTLLFAGPDGVGKRLAARWFAAFVNCAALAESRPCGVCASCQAIEAGAHLDLREIGPVSTTQSGRSKHRGDIKLDRLVEREGGDPDPLTPWLRSRPQERYKVAIIDQAESLTAAAANAFLKTLEEPPRTAVIVLLATSPDALLPTVASRAAVVRFGAVQVSGFDDLAPHPGLRLGQPGSLLRARGDEGATMAARDAAAALLKTLEGDAYDAFEAGEELSAAVGQAAAAGADPGPLGWLREGLRELPAHAYADAIDRIERCEDALAAYANPALACSVLALGLRELLAGSPLPLGSQWREL